MKQIYTTIIAFTMLFGMQSTVMAEAYQAWGAVLFLTSHRPCMMLMRLSK